MKLLLPAVAKRPHLVPSVRPRVRAVAVCVAVGTQVDVRQEKGIKGGISCWGRGEESAEWDRSASVITKVSCGGTRRRAIRAGAAG